VWATFDPRMAFFCGLINYFPVTAPGNPLQPKERVSAVCQRAIHTAHIMQSLRESCSCAEVETRGKFLHNCTGKSGIWR